MKPIVQAELDIIIIIQLAGIGKTLQTDGQMNGHILYT
jgi:hypothetical protein